MLFNTHRRYTDTQLSRNRNRNITNPPLSSQRIQASSAPMTRPDSHNILSRSYTAFTPINQYELGETDLVLPSHSLASPPLASPPLSRPLTPSQGLRELKETRRKFRGLKVQFEDLEDKQRRAKEELRQEALRLWREELALEGRTWGEA